jgi:hypothetical protein
MRKSFGAILPLGAVGLGLGLVAFYSSCGSTGGGSSSTSGAAFGQFVSNSCGEPATGGGGNCLSLAAVNSVPADGVTIAGFRAQLVDGGGSPLPGVQICFAFENPGVATIIEPTNACGLTDGNGLVSGQFRAGTNTGSFALVATAPAGFGLQARRTISFTQAGAPTTPGVVGTVCATDSDCNSNLFCSFNDTCFPGASLCTQKIADTTTQCCANVECASGVCNAGFCQPTGAGTLANGAPCSSSTQCVSGCCDSNQSPDSCQPTGGGPVTCIP